jgi:hypothetical protein
LADNLLFSPAFLPGFFAFEREKIEREQKIEKEKTRHVRPTGIFVFNDLAPVRPSLTVTLAVTVADTVAVMETITDAITNHCALSLIRSSIVALPPAVNGYSLLGLYA